MVKDTHITLIIDALQGEASATLALKMAEVAAGANGSVLLMDADLAKSAMAKGMGIKAEKSLDIPALADVLSGAMTLNQAVFKYNKTDVILGNPAGKNITNFSESHFNILRDDFMLMASGYTKALVNVGAFPDTKGGLIFADGAGQALITTTPNPFAITKAYEIMAAMPKDVKLWLAVLGEQSENESSHVFITLMRSLKEMLKKELFFAGALNLSGESEIKKTALKLGLL